MTRKALSLCDAGWKPLALLLLVLALWPGAAAFADDEPDLIFRRSTVFKLLSPNDKLATYGVDDPEVEGVACHFTVPEKGGLKGWIGVAEEVSDISLACRQTGPITLPVKLPKEATVFTEDTSIFFKETRHAPVGRSPSHAGLSRYYCSGPMKY